MGAGIAPGSPVLRTGDFFHPTPQVDDSYVLAQPLLVGGCLHLLHLFPVLSQALHPPPSQRLHFSIGYLWSHFTVGNARPFSCRPLRLAGVGL